MSVFKLSEREDREAWGGVVHWLGWLALGALIVATGIHAITLVISQTGLQTGVMGAIRIASPVLVEVVAAVVAVGFAAHTWRSRQKTVGLIVEALWVAFAAANLITAFNLEAGATLTGAMAYWLAYGLPVSALVAGVLFYVMLRVDPDHRRAAEMKAATEQHEMDRFAAVVDVLESSQMAQVLRQRGWLDVVNRLAQEGYTNEQIAFMMQGTPALDAPAPAQLPDAPAQKPQDTRKEPAKITPPANGVNPTRPRSQS